MKKLLVSLTAVFATSAALAGYDTPDATVAALRDALAAGKLPQLSAFLPASYQSDITGLVQSFAGKMDPDLWTAGRNLLKTAGDSLAPKAAILADLIASESEATLTAADKTKAAASLGAALKGLSAFAGSDASSLNTLKTGSFATIEKAIAPVFLAAVTTQGGDFANMSIASSKTLDNGDVELTMSGDDTFTLRKVEGCWIPADMADGWSEVVNSARTSINSIDFSSTEGKQQKMQMLMLLPAIQGMVQQLGTANSADELKMMLGGLLGGGMGGGALPIPGL